MGLGPCSGNGEDLHHIQLLPPSSFLLPHYSFLLANSSLSPSSSLLLPSSFIPLLHHHSPFVIHPPFFSSFILPHLSFILLPSSLPPPPSFLLPHFSFRLPPSFLPSSYLLPSSFLIHPAAPLLSPSPPSSFLPPHPPAHGPRYPDTRGLGGGGGGDAGPVTQGSVSHPPQPSALGEGGAQLPTVTEPDRNPTRTFVNYMPSGQALHVNP